MANSALFGPICKLRWRLARGWSRAEELLRRSEPCGSCYTPHTLHGYRVANHSVTLARVAQRSTRYLPLRPLLTHF
jgi:hypothetical protein